MSTSVTINIEQHLGGGKHIQKDNNGRYYYINNSRNIYLTEGWYFTENGHYTKITHTPQDKDTIKNIIKGDKYLETFPSLSRNKSISVYYWSEDKNFENPLVVQLEPEGKYYTNNGSTTWTDTGGITTTLRSKLDGQNCTRNQAHIVKISYNSGNSYTCPSCGSKQVRVINYGTNDANSDYSYHYHTLTTGFSRFKDGKMEQTGIEFPESTIQVYVYQYPKGPEGIPLLIHFPYSSTDNPWYQRTSINSNSWTEVRDKKPSNYTGNDPEILELLKDILPTVTIDISKTDAQTGYEDPSEGGEVKQQIKVTRQNLEDEYVGFSHSIDNKDGFIVKSVIHGNSPLSNIPLNLVAKSVTAYYSDGPKFTLKNLLIVELTSHNGVRHKYFYKTTEEPPPTPIVDTSAQTGDSLPSGHQAAESSDAGVLAGTAIGAGLGGAGLGGLAVWKGPAILAKLIARL